MKQWSPEDLKKALDSGESVFLKLWKHGCGACKLASPAVERLEKANEFPVTYAEICIDDHPEMLEIAGTEVLPVFFVFHNKKKQSQLIGFKGIAKLQEMLQATFPKT